MFARILIIEDDPASRELVTYLLQAAGHATTEAADGEAGVRFALEVNPDMILCDLQIPLLNGYQVLQRLREDARWRRVPVIAVTAFSMPGDRENALVAGFAAHITKPIVPETFIAQVEAFLPPGLRATRPPCA